IELENPNIISPLSKEEVYTDFFNNGNRHITKNIYFEELYLHLPLLAAYLLNRSGDYVSAHEWYKKVYDPFLPKSKRQRFPFDEFFSGEFERPEEWLDDPIDPHAIAHRRSGVYLRHTILMMVKNLIDWADHEYALANPESVNRAKELYLLAKDVLDAPELDNPCKTKLQALEIEIFKYYSNIDHIEIEELLSPLNAINSNDIIRHASNQIIKTLHSHVMSDTKMTKKLEDIVQSALIKESHRKKSKSFKHIEMRNKNVIAKTEDSVMATSYGTLEAINPFNGEPVPNFFRVTFCVAPNPLLKAFQTYIGINLLKIRNCLTISGESSPVTILPTGGHTGEVITDINQVNDFSNKQDLDPPRYRYSFLVEKARQETAVAQQLGSALLSAIERRDNEDYNQLLAQNSIEFSGESVTLKNLQLIEAKDGKDVANTQLEKAKRGQFFWDERTKNGFMGLSALEVSAIIATTTLGIINNFEKTALYGAAIGAASGAGEGGVVAATGTVLSGGIAGIPSTIAGGGTAAVGGILGAGAGMLLGGLAAALPQLASYERRWEEWKLQEDLSQYDVTMANQQITLSEDRVNIAEQDKTIATLQQTHALNILNFLKEKDSNKELYEWMIDVLKENYGKVMRKATDTALLAQTALKFERQHEDQHELQYIKGDYWTINGNRLTDTQKEYALLGSDRLISDLVKLDEFKISNDKRSLQISKNISLAQMMPTEFSQFKQTGKLEFHTLKNWFDWDFPGHYMRLIKNVKMTIIALVPPTDGIHGMLSNNGTSNVIVKNDTGFVTKSAIRTFSDAIALDSPYNETGSFVMDYNDPMFLPFEGLGVETNWLFELPRATNRFNFETIADIVFTIEYTAKHDNDYKKQVIAELGNELSSDIVLSVKTNYPDEWYLLKNPLDPENGQEITIKLSSHSLLPSISDSHIEHFS
ncbi:MAG: hypothetical protein J7L77_03615, partial [Clostridiales bacterium]|nr:hypothetical protein [Clostridiales bacterium]